MKMLNNYAGNLDWLQEEMTSLMKSSYLDDTFYISIKNGDFYEFNIADNTQTRITHSTELRAIDQLFQVNESLMLAVDASANHVMLVSLDNTSSDTTLLCKGDNCCLDNSPCFHSPDVQLGRVTVDPNHPYNLFYVDGNEILQLRLNSTNQYYTVSIMQQIEAQGVLQLTLTNDFNTLTAVTSSVNGTTNELTYRKKDLTSESQASEMQRISVPEAIERALQLDNDTLVVLVGKKMEVMLIDMVLNRTQNVCTVQNSNSILINSQDSNCQAIDRIHSITADKDKGYIYAVSGKWKRRMFTIHYTALGNESSSPPKASEAVTDHEDKTGSSKVVSNWVETAIIILSTALSLLIIGAVCYSFLNCVRKHHQPSKRPTLDQQQASSHDVQDIELTEIGSSLSNRQPINVGVASVPQGAVNDSSRDRPLPPLPSSLARDTEVDIENYENPLSCANPINQTPPAPPPCPGPSTSRKKTLAPQIPLQHGKEHSEHCDSSAHYCDQPPNTVDIPSSRTIPPNPVLDPTVLQEALSAIQSASNQRVSSVTLTNNEVRFDFTPQHVPTPEHEYLTINDR